MTACPKCAHPHVVKAGKVEGTQRWLCRGYGGQFTHTTRRGRPLWQTSLAVFLYRHGVSMNALAKMFGVCASTILTRHGFGRFKRQSIMVSKAEDMVELTMALSPRFRVNGDDLDNTLPSPKRQHYLCRTTHDRRC
jgi:transposase-like protein